MFLCEYFYIRIKIYKYNKCLKISNPFTKWCKTINENVGDEIVILIKCYTYSLFVKTFGD